MSKKKPYTPRNRDHIHTVDDGRGFRSVYVDGGRIEKAFYADERKGVVYYHPRPLRPNKRRHARYGEHCIVTRAKRGKVTIKWLTA